jgi:ketosteroid isomerase-like protein
MLTKLYEAFSRGDVPVVMGLLSDDITYRISGSSPVSGDYAGKAEVLGFFGKLMELSGGTFQLTVLDILANDQHGAVFTMERAQRDGKALTNHAVHAWDVEDGECIRFRGYNEEVWDPFWS